MTNLEFHDRIIVGGDCVFYEFSQADLSNLVAFLDRVDLKGIQEAKAMVTIITILSNPRQLDGSDAVESKEV